MENPIQDQQELRKERIIRNSNLYNRGFFMPTTKELAEINDYEQNNEVVRPVSFGPESFVLQAAEVELDYGNVAVA